MFDQRDQEVAADRALAQVPHQHRHARVEVERLAHLRAPLRSWRPWKQLTPTTKGMPRLSKKSMDAKLASSRRVSTMHDRAERAVHQVVPHEPEALLARACRTGRPPARGRG